MTQPIPKLPAGTIRRININGLAGRVLEIPSVDTSVRDQEILVVYGMHSSLERYYTLAWSFADFGNVTLPDIPGHGGMDSFYKIGMEPTCDNYGDYLAAFIKLKYRNKRLVIVGISLGFQFVTNMLARYPDVAANADLVVSIVGFTHRDDFRFKKINYWLLRASGSFVSHRFVSVIARKLIFNTFVTTSVNKLWGSKQLNKYTGLDRDSLKENMRQDVLLWRINDLRTRAYTGRAMLVADLTNLRVPMPVHHVYVPDDQYFYRDKVKEHMAQIYSGYHSYLADVESHNTAHVVSKEDAASMVPRELHNLLKPKKRRTRARS